MTALLSEYYRAGATRRVLEIFTSEPSENVFDFKKYYIVDKSQVQVVNESKKTSVYINPLNPIKEQNQKIFVAIIRGYDLAKEQGNFYVFEKSSATCESGIIVVCDIGSIIKEYGYKLRRPPKYWKLDYKVTNVTAEIEQQQAKPLEAK